MGKRSPFRICPQSLAKGGGGRRGKGGGAAGSREGEERAGGGGETQLPYQGLELGFPRDPGAHAFCVHRVSNNDLASSGPQTPRLPHGLVTVPAAPGVDRASDSSVVGAGIAAVSAGQVDTRQSRAPPHLRTCWARRHVVALTGTVLGRILSCGPTLRERRGRRLAHRSSRGVSAFVFPVVKAGKF